MIGSILKLLLNRHSSLEVPGLGTFIAEYVAANLQFANKTIRHSDLQISFIPKSSSNQAGPLKSYLIDVIGLSKPKAEKIILEFNNEVKNGLEKNKKFEIKGLGWLTKDIENGINFEMYPDFTYNFDSYGLKVLQAETLYSKTKIDPTRETPVIPLHPFDEDLIATKELPGERKSGFKWASVAAVFIATVVSIGSVYLLSTQSTNSTVSLDAKVSTRQEATLVPVSRNEGEIVLKPETPKIKPELKAAANSFIENKAESISPKATLSSAHFLVVVGSFKDENRSLELGKNLKQKGFQSEVLERNPENFIRVSAGSFSTKPDALTFIGQIQADFTENLWILKIE